jgi:hypothetical protein
LIAYDPERDKHGIFFCDSNWGALDTRSKCKTKFEHTAAFMLFYQATCKFYLY